MGSVYWRLSYFYFFYYSVLGGWLPYWGIYLGGRGYSVSEIGMVIASILGMRLIGPLLWGWIADHKGAHLLTTSVGAFLATLLFSLFLLDLNFSGLILVSMSVGFFWSAILPQFEAITLNHLHGKSERYSLIRLWGSIGFILSVFCMGVVFYYFSVDVLPFIILVLMSCIFLSTLFLGKSRIEPKGREAQGNGLFFQLRRSQVWYFLVACIFTQFSHGAYYAFYSIYLSEYDYSKIWIGAMWTIGIIAEVVMFMFLPKIMRNFSVKLVLLVSFAVTAVRWQILAYAEGVLAVLIFVQLLHAFTFSSSHAAAIEVVRRLFRGGTEGRGQALYSALGFGLGSASGSWIGGILWGAHGATVVYTVAAMVALLGFFLIIRLKVPEG